MVERKNAAEAQLAAAQAERDALVAELTALGNDARRHASLSGVWARLWQVSGTLLGLATAVLAAVAGAAGLATTTGRVPAAILALTAAGLTAANQFLRTDDHYEKNLRRRNAWEALQRDTLLEKARTSSEPVDVLYQILRGLLLRRLAIRSMNHEPIPPDALTAAAPEPHVRPAEQPQV